MKIKKLVMTVLVLLSVQMCGPEPKLDYNVTKSESYKISEKKMKKFATEFFYWGILNFMSPFSPSFKTMLKSSSYDWQLIPRQDSPGSYFRYSVKL